MLLSGPREAHVVITGAALRRADGTLYSAKRDGRGRIAIAA